MRCPFHRPLLAALIGSALLAPAAFAQQKRDNALFDAATAEQPFVVKTLEKLVDDRKH